MSLDDGQRCGQAQPGTFADVFSREERVEDPVDDFMRDAGARVLDFDHHIGAGPSVDVHRGEGLIDDDVLRRDCDSPPGRHRVAGVHAQIEQHLVELGGVSL